MKNSVHFTFIQQYIAATEGATVGHSSVCCHISGSKYDRRSYKEVWWSSPRNFLKMQIILPVFWSISEQHTEVRVCFVLIRRIALITDTHGPVFNKCILIH